MEMSGAIGAAGGPFFGSTLNYYFGYEGPFITFAGLYILIFFALRIYIPEEKEIIKKLEET